MAAEQLNFSKGSVQTILQNNSNMWKLCAKLVKRRYLTRFFFFLNIHFIRKCHPCNFFLIHYKVRNITWKQYKDSTKRSDEDAKTSHFTQRHWSKRIDVQELYRV